MGQEPTPMNGPDAPDTTSTDDLAPRRQDIDHTRGAAEDEAVDERVSPQRGEMEDEAVDERVSPQRGEAEGTPEATNDQVSPQRGDTPRPNRMRQLWTTFRDAVMGDRTSDVHETAQEPARDAADDLEGSTRDPAEDVRGQARQEGQHVEDDAQQSSQQLRHRS